MPFTSLRFQLSWRSYQAHFLAHFQAHITDGHLHVVAPPGSGKTLLGLEMVRQLNQKTLVLAPTLTIRNQWYDRLCSYFSPDNAFTDHSFDLAQPKAITFTTYQALYALYKRCGSADAYLHFFEQHAFGTIVLDEAHHLKNSWWTPLFRLKKSSDATLVALTATPPYDSPQHELDKYFQLCGPIDDEIAVPDLVREKDLCPHQDFVHFSTPDEALIQRIAQFRLAVANYIDTLPKQEALVTYVQKHPFLSDTANHLEAIYKAPEVFSAFLIFLNASGTPFPKEKLQVLGFSEKESLTIPPWQLAWATTFLNAILFNPSDVYRLPKELEKTLKSDLRRLGILKTHRIDLVGEADFYRQLSSSPAKLRSIVDICQAAQAQRGDDLRAVILTDYIRKAFLDQEIDEDQHFGKLGAVPIFKALCHKLEETDGLAVLTGSVILVSSTILSRIQTQFPEVEAKGKPIPTIPGFVQLQLDSAANPVGVLTQLFQEGHIKILIGTKALLGEGWDAPALNTLILASFVGSFVSSNQMRGRAIRTFKPVPDKTAVIWHLCCLDFSDPTGGADMHRLSRRFSAFMGVSQNTPLSIENGWERLGLGLPTTPEAMLQTNTDSLHASQNLAQIRANWATAIAKPGTLVRELKSYLPKQTEFQKTKRLRQRDLVQYGITQFIWSLGYFIPEFLVKNLKLILTKGWIQAIYALVTVLFFGYGLRLFRLVKAYLYFGKIHTHVEKMGWAVLYSLRDLRYLRTPFENLKIECYTTDDAIIHCALVGGSEYESTLFIDALEALLQPIENPRYLISRTPFWRKSLGVPLYYSVPDIFADKKERATVFHQHWRNLIGRSDLLYTRTLEGRRLLVQIRLRQLGDSDAPTKQATVWK